MAAERSTSVSLSSLDTGLPWYGAEFITSGGYAFSLIACRALFPTDDFVASHVAMLYAGASKDIAVLAPAILIGLTTWMFATSAASRCPSLGHPLVAIGLWVNGQLLFRRLLMAIGVQLMGAVAGAMFARAFFAEDLVLHDTSLMTYSSTFQLGQAVLFEMAMGFFVIWTLFSLASFRPAIAQWQTALSTGFVIGLVAMVLSIGGRYLTGGIANPVVAMGMASATGRPIDLLVYVVAPAVGAVTAAILGGGPRLALDRS